MMASEDDGQIPVEHFGVDELGVSASELISSVVPPKRVPRKNDPLHCEICQRDFKQRRFYVEHMKCHSSVPLPQYCLLCSEVFDDDASLQAHIKTSHRDDPDRVEKKAFACHLCDRSYGAKANLELHLKKAHNWTRLCGKCGLSFESARGLERHLRLSSCSRGDPRKLRLCGVLKQTPLSNSPDART